ncbi:aspartate/glutamate racemase family protein [Selenomonas noxia]|uniref:aspartate/glutamate racemase family protein n=1 Tax=Selenomonas noxia TaxID=135083 RepID=UPI0031B9CEF1
MMKTIGLIGSMSWESTVTYYQVINETIKKQLGGLHSAKCILYSVDFDEIEKYQASGEWDKSADILSEAAQALERAGADYIVICTNTMHKVAPEIGRRIHIPILHIADMTAAELQKQGIKKVGLLGTKYTMRQDFYKNILIEQGIEVVIPNDADVDVVNRIIYDELCLGKISEQSKDIYLDIIMKLAQDGAQGIILGCTEIGLLVRQSDTDIPLFDTTLIHAEQAALKSLER